LSELEYGELKYLALVTLGTPFCGTGRLLDPLMRRVKIDYIQSMLAEEENHGLLEELLDRTSGIQCRILLGEIERDELVSASSCLTPAHWLSARASTPNLKWGTFKIASGRLIRAHDGLLHDRLAVNFIDGLLDGLLPDSSQN
jgi:hypothetical protein